MITNYDDQMMHNQASDTAPIISGTVVDGNYMLSANHADIQDFLQHSFPTVEQVSYKLNSILLENRYTVEREIRSCHGGSDAMRYLVGTKQSVEDVISRIERGEELKSIMRDIYERANVEKEAFDITGQDPDTLRGVKDGYNKLLDIIKEVIANYAEEVLLHRHVLPVRR